MKKLFIIYMMCFASVAFSQDIRGFYIYTRIDANVNYFLNVTLFTDASKNINRPDVEIFLGPSFFPGYAVLPLITTTITNGVNLATYSNTNTINLIGGNLLPSYTDSFWVDGIKNFSTPDKSRIMVFDIMSSQGESLDTEPEVTNLPVSLSNFTVSGNQVLYNPVCHDADGDSLSYELTDYYLFGALYGSYHLPAGATIDPLTGLFSFSKDSTDQGLYAFLISINEWRRESGYLNNIGSTQLGFVLTTNLTLGVKDFGSLLRSIRLYPDPTSEMLNFAPGTFKENEKVSIEITNALGEVVLQRKDFTSTQGLDVSGLQQGVYFVNVREGERTFSNKFVKVDN